MRPAPILIFLASLAGAAMADTKWGGPAPKDDRMSLDPLPECWQECFNEGNKLSKPWDVNTISKRDFCEDKYFAVSYWRGYTLNPCTAKKCPNKEVHNTARKWYREMCEPYLGDDL
ncbi:hypothetical protein CkaCkLH20_09261 [Colletotrichum karsti]|uniref:Uncharacterized protein n=1 Tax=Colletotrichum karsti TaxID=1095194 RepID=A0A9P6HX49_9PEZI|nr:uncharacterized protein CkaCkLH20_09261 [Colletotrichum karsti]KAF9873098.1 hypothetical protein CkaCkLH20_09261 [Colletotrichum karsti]